MGQGWGEEKGPSPEQELAVVEREVRLLRHAVRSLFEQAAQAGQRTIMIVGTEDDIADVRAAVDRALVAHPEDPTLGAAETHVAHVEDGGWVVRHPAWCAATDAAVCTEFHDRFISWMKSRGGLVRDGDYVVMVDADDDSTIVREIEPAQ